MGSFSAMYYMDNPTETEKFGVKFVTDAVSPNLPHISRLLNMTVNCCHLPERYCDKNKHADDVFKYL